VAVDDHGLEVLKKSGEEVTPGDKSDYYIKVGIVSGGASGTQYTEGDTDASITGNAILYEGPLDTLTVPSATNPLPVEIIAGDVEGTEYTEGDIDSSISGKAILFEGSGDTLKVPSSTNPLPVTEIENDKNQVLEAEDVLETYTFLDFGTKNERLDTIVYTAASVPGVTVTKDFSYVAAGSSYRLTTIQWSVT
jgi:hypothetical protein